MFANSSKVPLMVCRWAGIERQVYVVQRSLTSRMPDRQQLIRAAMQDIRVKNEIKKLMHKVLSVGRY